MLYKSKPCLSYWSLSSFTILFILIFLTNTICFAQHLEQQQWNYFEGRIGNDDVRLAVYFEGYGAVTGSFCFRKDQTKISFNGTINPTEMNFKVDTSKAGFTGKLITDKNQDKLVGNYYSNDPGDTSTAFTLKLKGYGQGNATKMYPVFKSSDEAVEKFSQLAVQSILADDRAWIMTHLYFPLLWWNNTDWSSYNIRKEQMESFYPKIFNASFKEKLKSAYTVNLSHGQFGVTLGNSDNGLLTVLYVLDPKTNKERFVITSIDCPDQVELQETEEEQKD
jgi:hypothetical protein